MIMNFISIMIIKKGVGATLSSARSALRMLNCSRRGGAGQRPAPGVNA